MAKTTEKETIRMETADTPVGIAVDLASAAGSGGAAAGKEKSGAAYTVPELAANARKIFGTRPECVTAALRAAGREVFTVTEAKGIVSRFLKKEVR